MRSISDRRMRTTPPTRFAPRRLARIQLRIVREVTPSSRATSATVRYLRSGFVFGPSIVFASPLEFATTRMVRAGGSPRQQPHECLQQGHCRRFDGLVWSVVAHHPGGMHRSVESVEGVKFLGLRALRSDQPTHKEGLAPQWTISPISFGCFSSSFSYCVLGKLLGPSRAMLSL